MSKISEKIMPYLKWNMRFRMILTIKIRWRQLPNNLTPYNPLILLHQEDRLIKTLNKTKFHSHIAMTW